jgi:hypothetical protein
MRRMGLVFMGIQNNSTSCQEYTGVMTLTVELDELTVARARKLAEQRRSSVDAVVAEGLTRLEGQVASESTGVTLDQFRTKLGIAGAFVEPFANDAEIDRAALIPDAEIPTTLAKVLKMVGGVGVCPPYTRDQLHER